MFHHFHDDKKHIWTQGSITETDFVKILNYIGPERILSPQEWLDKLDNGKLAPADLCLTFDHNLLSQMELALPVLDHFKLKAFWFVYSGIFDGKSGNIEIYRFFRTKYFDNLEDFYRIFFQKVLESGIIDSSDPDLEEKGIGELQNKFPFYSRNDARFRFVRDKVLGKENYEKLTDSLLEEYGVNKSDLAKNLWMSESDLKQLSKNGHLIGLHSHSHPLIFADLSYQEQFWEYQKNYLYLNKICGENPVAMSYPNNSYNEDTLRVLQELNIHCGFLSNIVSKPIVKNEFSVSKLEIPREDCVNLLRMF